MRYAARVVLIGVFMLLRLHAAVIDSSYQYSLQDGSSLTIRRLFPGIRANEQGTYELLYGRQDGTETTIWTSPNFNGTLFLSDVKTAYISDGRVTALFESGPGEVFVLQVPEIPDHGESRSLELTGLLKVWGLGPNGLESNFRQDLHLTDHNHFEILGQEGARKMVFVNPRNFAATVDGKPVATYLFYEGRVIGLPEQPPSKSEPSSPAAKTQPGNPGSDTPVSSNPLSNPAVAVPPSETAKSGLAMHGRKDQPKQNARPEHSPIWAFVIIVVAVLGTIFLWLRRPSR